MKQSVDGLTTARLQLRRFVPDDLDELARLNADPEVMRYSGGPMTREATVGLLQERILDYYEQHPGLGIWRTLERESGACVGFHVLNHIQGETLIQVGFRLARPYWGRGYATEMSLALLRYGFETLGLDRIVGIADPGNAASHKVLLKCGLRRRGFRSFTHPAYARFGACAYFERRGESWMKERRTLPRAASGGP